MNRVRTLIADDSRAFRGALARFLGALPDVELVGAASGGQESVEMAEALRPDLALMDFQMPGMNGLEAMERIRVGMPAIRVIILTVHDSEDLRALCHERGADGFLEKARLTAELPALIRSWAGPPPS